MEIEPFRSPAPPVGSLSDRFRKSVHDSGGCDNSRDARRRIRATTTSTGMLDNTAAHTQTTRGSCQSVQIALIRAISGLLARYKTRARSPRRKIEAGTEMSTLPPAPMWQAEEFRRGSASATSRRIDFYGRVNPASTVVPPGRGPPRLLPPGRKPNHPNDCSCAVRAAQRQRPPV